MPSRVDIQGQRFGRLVVVRKAPSKKRHTYWTCRCDCGAEVIVRTDALTGGAASSCGCYHRDAVTKHGMWDSAEYAIWRAMLNRCENPRFKFYSRYGGRGISVCEQWHDFEQFYQDMGSKPKGKSLDRIDNDGDYEPGNCRWATPKTQGRNRNDNRTLTYKGETKCIAAWAEWAGLRDGTLRERLRRGWTLKKALTKPVDLGNRWK